MQDLFTNLLEQLGLAWWVEISTDLPRCTYYFGPFLNVKLAESAKSGYIDDLEQEGAQGIRVKVKRCKPSQLTVAEDLGDLGRVSGRWSSQLP
jgi:hypothetical protein